MKKMQNLMLMSGNGDALFRIALCGLRRIEYAH